MKLIIKGYKYHLKYGYKALAKSGVLEDVAKMEELFSGADDNENDMSMLKKMPEVFESIAKLVLAGLQKYNEGFRVDYDDPESVQNGMNMVYDFLDDYSEEEDSVDMMELFTKLTEELLDGGFLSKKTPKLEKQLTEQDATVVPMDHIRSLD